MTGDRRETTSNNIKIPWTSMVGTPNEYSGQILVGARWVLETSSWNWILRSGLASLSHLPLDIRTYRMLAEMCHESVPLRSEQMPDQAQRQPLFLRTTFFWPPWKSVSWAWLCYGEQGDISVGETKGESGTSSFLCLESFTPSILPSQDTC